MLSNRFAAWTCRKGVRVYDVVEAKVIALIKCPAEHEALHRRGGAGEVSRVPYRIAW